MLEWQREGRPPLHRTSGQDIFRGDRLPEDLRGQLLFAEPAGRLIRRSSITVEDGITRLANVYEKGHGEFIRSTDPLFCPVNMTTAPDGTLYIVNMYRGVIEESEWTRKGSEIREQTDELGLARQTGRGRLSKRSGMRRIVRIRWSTAFQQT